MSFKSKVVIVTGSSAGIGAAIAIAFSREGADVVITGRNSERLKKVAEECEINPLVIQADLTNDDDVEQIVNKTIETHSKIDILVNNAGIVRMSSLVDDTFLKTYDEVNKTNLRAVIKITNMVTPHIILTKGNIINISSVSGRQLYSHHYTVYGMLKASLDYFTQGTALELGKYGVRVNAVSPGPVKTDIKPTSDSKFERPTFPTVLSRYSSSEEIADVVLFLAGDKACGITGSNYTVDNGYLLVK